MFVNPSPFFAISHPFYQAFIHSDFLGKLIFFSLLLLSIACWTLLLQKFLLIQKVESNRENFAKQIHRTQQTPLGLEAGKREIRNPFQEIYRVIKKETLDLLNKNQMIEGKKAEVAYLSSSDIDSIDGHANATIDQEVKDLEANLFILSTIVGLAPLIGLLGTVWGILITFSELQTAAVSSTNQAVLSGISLALTTTVLGILDAIPALIGFNYFKNKIHAMELAMEHFAHDVLSSIEKQYRKVEIHTHE